MDNTLNLSQEQREKVKVLFEKIDTLQAEGSGHKKIFEHSQELLEILPNDLAVIQTYLVSLIKTKQFKEALSFLNKTTGANRESLIYEHAYILHRAGDNSQALTKLKTLEDQSSAQCKHLMSQINYKLSEYAKSVSTYQEILDQDADLDQDEVADIATNYLACQSSIGNRQEVEKFIAKYCENSSFEKTYEFYFNLS